MLSNFELCCDLFDQTFQHSKIINFRKSELTSNFYLNLSGMSLIISFATGFDLAAFIYFSFPKTEIAFKKKRQSLDQAKRQVVIWYKGASSQNSLIFVLTYFSCDKTMF